MSPKLQRPVPKAGSRGVIPRIGSSLYTAKHPGRCPNCGSTNLARKGDMASDCLIGRQVFGAQRNAMLSLESPDVGRREPDRHLNGERHGIDFVQVRNGAVHILDYKPDARTNKPFAQLTIYALALTRLVPGLRLFELWPEVGDGVTG